MVVCDPYWKETYWSLYKYEPSMPGAAIFCCLFGLSLILHALQMVRSRTWYLSALLIGAACETIGYASRIISATEDPGCWTLGPYVTQNILILIAPPFFAASIYMILGRIILLTEGEAYAVIKRRWLTKVFVTGDVISLLMQGSGGGMMATGEDLLKTGEKIIIAGLFIQLAVFGFFVIVGAIFHYRMSRNPTHLACHPSIRWKNYLLTLYVTSALIWVRSVFRVIEYIQGNDGYLMSREAFLFAFDGMLMLMMLLWMNWFHPSEIGVLLRGGEPVKHGLELVTKTRSGRTMALTMESNASSQGPVANGPLA
ncbi:hypothetical protein NM208_g9647 [Fusarium decemcellulare]|uniref:Uncharacterized protein n=1 Tax=Fusarium decemcellulare TaxID=57161 RepID=A0ACC1S0R9_9HYPO|nr:hypothetical protein NM208_g9647 [Fusarium decemcellulare]